MSAHRHWRIYVTKTCSPQSGFCSFMELELRTSLGGSSVAPGSGGTASSSGYDFGWSPDNAFNGSISGSGWHSPAGSGPWWVAFDFGSGNDKDIIEVALTGQSGSNNRTPSSFLIQYSDDGSSWTTLFDIVDEDIYGNSEVRVFNASDSPTKNGNKTFWRINATANGTSDGILGVEEIEMATTPGGADVTSGGKGYRYPSGSVGHEVANAFDSTPGTDTSSSTSGEAWPKYIGYRFGSAQDIAEMRITARGSGSEQHAPTAFTIEYWDGSAYQVAATYSSLSWSSTETKTFTFGTGAVTRPTVFVCT
jgi:hypothetical protein